jgi:hypothetical protein
MISYHSYDQRSRYDKRSLTPWEVSGGQVAEARARVEEVEEKLRSETDKMNRAPNLVCVCVRACVRACVCACV